MRKTILSIYVFLIFFIVMALNFNYQNKITGAAVAMDIDFFEEGKAFGSYFIKPNFRINIDYDLDDYEQIQNKLLEIVECSRDGSVESCTKMASESMEGFEWQLNCDVNGRRIFYEFAEFYQNCLDSDDSNCFCEYDLLKNTREIDDYNLQGEHEIEFGGFLDNRHGIEVRMEEQELKHVLKGKKLIGWFPKRFKLEYSDEGLEKALMRFINELAVDEVYDISYTEKLLLFKEPTEEEDTEQINVVEVEELAEGRYNVKYPGERQKVISEIKSCEPKPKNIRKFCVTNQNKKFLVYDEKEGKLLSKNPVIKFAAYIPDKAPEAVEGLGVFDRPKDSSSIILKWDESKEEDVVKYRVYFAESSLNAFEKTKVEEIKKDKNILKKDFEESKREEVDAFSLVPNECYFDYSKKQCLFTTSAGREKEGQELNYDALVFFKDEERYYTSFKVPNNGEYDFLVTAIDKNGNEIEEIEETEIVKNKESKDDLPIDSKGIVSTNYWDLNDAYDSEKKEISFKIIKNPDSLVNIDNSETEDFGEYEISYIKFSDLSPDETKEKLELMKDFSLVDFQFIKYSNYPSGPEKIVRVRLASTSPSPNDIYFFVIVAKDNLKNPEKSKFKLKELGVSPVLYTIT